MKNLSDQILMDSYQQAVTSNLHPRFINLLRLEIHRRELAIQGQVLSS